MSEHERWGDSAAAFLLEALPPDEQSAYEAHMASCRICRDEVEHLRPAAEAIPVSSTPMMPPAALKDRIMAEVRREAALLEAAGPDADRPPAPAPRRRRWGYVLPRLAMVAGVLAIGVVLGGVFLSGGTQTTPLVVDREQAPAASGELHMDGEAMLVVNDLPAPPAGRVYQVWVVPEGTEAPEPTEALFAPRSDGSAVTAVPLPAGDVESVLVTHEPLGGSDEPTRTPLLSVSPS